MNDAMVVDATNWSSAAGVQCRKCEQFGHKANKCPPGRNQNNDNGQNQGSLGGRYHQNNYRRKFQQLYQYQHQQQPRPPPPRLQLKQDQSGRSSLFCANCPTKTNHTTQDCRKKPRQQRSNGLQNTASDSGFKHDTTDQSSNVHASQMALMPYCPGCNFGGHTEDQCFDTEAPRRLRRSPIICQKCDTRGHTKDECRNPVTTKCGHCCRPGHSKNQCRSHMYFPIYVSRATDRFKFKRPDANGAWSLQFREQMPVLQQDQRSRSLSITMTNCSAPSTTFAADRSSHERQVRAKIDRSACNYTKRNANRAFYDWERALLNSTVRTSQTERVLFQAKEKICQGWNFWRDPRAMEAVALCQKPVCRTCGLDGFILDKNMFEIPCPVDVLTIEDYSDWGIFVLFTCRCCNEGFDYKPR